MHTSGELQKTTRGGGMTWRESLGIDATGTGEVGREVVAEARARTCDPLGECSV